MFGVWVVRTEREGEAQKTSHRGNTQIHQPNVDDRVPSSESVGRWLNTI